MRTKSLAKMAIATLAIAGGLSAAPVHADDMSAKKDIIKTYSTIAAAAYGDSLTGAKKLQSAIAALVAQPTEATLSAARSAWIEAREPYQQTEAYRFGNAIVDDWEGQVNAWPLDEGLSDYVQTDTSGDESEGKRS